MNGLNIWKLKATPSQSLYFGDLQLINKQTEGVSAAKSRRVCNIYVN